MDQRKTAPALTPDLIARRHPSLPEADDPTASPEAPEEALEAGLAAMAEALGEEVWVFGYGSLMWNPEMDFAEHRRARLHGYERRFCLWQWRYRGTRTQPGMMLALEPAENAQTHCDGVVFRLSGDLATRLRPVWWREMRGRAYRPLMVEPLTDDGPLRALTFVADREAPRYAGPLDEETLARNIAAAAGSRGASAEYLYETWRHCCEIGIEDPMLEALQARVAAILAAEG